jgi:hypothetical protein
MMPDIGAYEYSGMPFSASIGTINAMPEYPDGFEAVDPCSCNNDATKAQNDGTFNEFITVSGPSGALVTGTAVGGNPENLIFTEFPLNSGTYISNIFTHVDNVGYTAYLYANGAPVAFDTIGNKCLYPNIAIDPLGPFFSQSGQVDEPLNAIITGVTMPDNGVFTWSGPGVTGNSFNPSGLMIGIADITLSYDAIFESNISTLTLAGDTIAALPGCTQLSTSSIIIKESTSLSCFGKMNISVDENCSVNSSAAGFLPSGATGMRYIIDGKYLLSGNTLTSTGGLKLGATATQVNLITRNVMKLLIGKRIKYEMLGNGNLCWGELVFEDKMAPSIRSVDNITIECADTSVELLNDINGQGTRLVKRRPLVIDNCGFRDSSLTVQNFISGNCTGMIIRIWTFTDCGNMTVTSSDTIFVKSINRSRVMCPEPLVTIECGTSTTPAAIVAYYRTKIIEDSISLIKSIRAVSKADSVRISLKADTLSLKYGYPWFKGPMVDTIKGIFDPLEYTKNVCGYLVTFKDENILNTCCAQKIKRTWFIVDWCNNIIKNDCSSQVIQIKDFTKPTITVPVGEVVVATSSWTCTAAVGVPSFTALDNCDAAPAKVAFNRATGLPLGATTVLECGVYEFGFYAQDCCGNISDTIYRTVRVVDRTPPVPVVKQDIVISIAPGGYDQGGDLQAASAKLFIESVNNGSYDACGQPVFMEIRRTKSAPSCFNLGDKSYNNNLTFRDASASCGRGATRKYRTGWDVNCHELFATYDCKGTKISGDGAGSITINASGSVGTLPVKTSASPSCVASGRYDQLVTGVDGSGDYSICDTDGGQYVTFCCADLDAIEVDANGDGKIDALDKGFVEVQFRVWDDANKDGKYECGVDNFNDSWAYVKVESKVPPVLTCPSNITVGCESAIATNDGTYWVAAMPSLFSMTGIPTAWTSCGVQEVEYKDVVTLNQCKSGTITRTFRVSGNNPELTCTQIITVTSGHNSTQFWEFPGSYLGNPSALSDNIQSLSSFRRYLPVTSNPDGEIPNKISVCGISQNTTGLTNAPIIGVDPNITINYSKVILETNDCDGPSVKDIKNARPYYVQGPCDVIGVNTDIEVYNFEDGVCRKWVVTYTFINWCDNRCVRFKQDWIYRDTEAPTIDCTSQAIFHQQENCVTNITLKKLANDVGGCKGVEAENSGWLKWEVFVDEWSDGTWNYAYSSFRAPQTSTTEWVDVTYGGINTNVNPSGLIPTKYLAPTDPGTFANIDFRFPIPEKESTHKVLWRVYDGCQNSNQCIEEIVVKDLKPPTPYCIPLSTALMQVPAGEPAGTGPMVEIWAIDFDRGSSDFCTGQKDLKFTFNNWKPNADRINNEHYFDATGRGFDITTNNTIRYHKGEYQRWLPDQHSSAMIFTKANLPGLTLKMSVIDLNNNIDFCSVDLRLVCNDPVNCPPSAGSRIAGTVKTAGDQPVNNVTVTINASISELPISVYSDATGAYEKTVPSGLDYDLRASKGGDYSNGVSTLDLVMIQRHILGIQKIDSPYKLIAADATNDGKVTAADITELRKLILGIANELPNNASWRFPVLSQTMDAANPFPFREKIVIASISDDQMGQNFVATKIGDVNGNVSINVANPIVEARSSIQVDFVVDEKSYAEGATVEIPVKAINFSDIYGYQLTLNLKGASFVKIYAGAIEVNSNNIGILNGNVITMSYASDQALTLREDEILFTIVAKAIKAGTIHEMMDMNSSITKSESYIGPDLQVGRLNLVVLGTEIGKIILYQNEPNPFNGQTKISYNMPEPAHAIITVYDINGRVLSVRKAEAKKGINEEIFTRSEFGSSGIFYYTLESGDFKAIKKMVIF